ncbi:dihydrofolate reductase family protein [Nonomuraea sp. B12E4]|uniref:dihydrofolate reductase family protein n=1 Tax=Nonomuraea sp. B12E4 TaxID=3153564 RepID=UPI00325C37C1
MRLIVTSHLTLDGVMQSNGKPEPELNDGFEHGGWQVPYFGQDLARLTAGWIAAADAFLLGRTTYELFAGYWSKVTDPDDPHATRLNALPKYVASTTLDRVEWNNSTLLRGDLAEEVAKLKRRPGNELQVHGSAALVRTLMKHDLVDEYRLLIHPVVLGGGKRLFAGGTAPTAFELIDTKIIGRGVVVHTYRPSGKPEYVVATLGQEGDVVRDSVGLGRQTAT